VAVTVDEIRMRSLDRTRHEMLLGRARAKGEMPGCSKNRGGQQLASLALSREKSCCPCIAQEPLQATGLGHGDGPPKRRQAVVTKCNMVHGP
jgi:hypothetical protein